MIEFTKYTPWENVINAVKNELMIVGGMAFILKVIFNYAKL
jgi:hypothetical protein